MTGTKIKGVKLLESKRLFPQAINDVSVVVGFLTNMRGLIGIGGA